MNIGFVAEPYEESGASGMGYLVMELIKNLPVAGKEHSFTIYSSVSIQKEFVSVPFKNVLVPRGFLGKFFWFVRTKEDIDALLFITPLLPLVIPRRIKAIPICPELVSQKITPGSFRERVIAVLRDQVLMPHCMRRATKIITISHATEADIKKYYNVPEEKIAVIYAGFQDLSSFVETAPTIDEKMRPYFFFTGRAKPRKNVHGIVSAFISLKKRTASTCKLVIAGKASGPYYQSILKLLTKEGLLSDVFFVGYVSTEQLCAFYKNAIALVFPSFNEGFGMPVAEAMSLGTPVITSNASSLPEVAGDAGLLVDPHDTEAISAAMEKLLADPALRASLAQKGPAQAQHFSWQKAAQEYMAVLATVERSSL
jgi:glycosyltransferase involved in cell wall biosynthesis